MKNTLVFAAALATLLTAGIAMAGHEYGGARHDELRADTNGDGRVSRTEAVDAGAKRAGEWFDKLDLDKDGFLTREEMQKTRKAHHEQLREKMEERFKAADTNSDGQLSLDEVQTQKPQLAERFGELDQDKNGLLSKEELRRFHRPTPPPQN
jgi:Ca2+-binding EF-hand superfamily protein